MKKKRIMASFPIRILAVSIPGLLAGLFLNATRTIGLTSGALNLVVTARYVRHSGQELDQVGRGGRLPRAGHGGRPQDLRRGFPGVHHRR